MKRRPGLLVHVALYLVPTALILGICFLYREMWRQIILLIVGFVLLASMVGFGALILDWQRGEPGGDEQI